MGSTLLETRIRHTITAVKHAAAMISTERGNKVSEHEIESALVEILELDRFTDILDRDIDAQAISLHLAGYNFARLRPTVLAEIEFEESIIPAGVPILLTEAEVKLKGEKWVVHKNDTDPFPSNPHAHNYPNRLKMHLGNGDLYKGTERTPCKRMKLALLVELRDRVAQKNPSIKLPPLVV